LKSGKSWDPAAHSQAMDNTAPRFEFRVFGASLGMAEQRMRGIAPCESISESREIYLLGHGIDSGSNIKIRHGRLELKQLIEHHRELQRWQPAGQWAFPVAFHTIQGMLDPAHTPNHSRNPAALLSLDDLLRFTTQTAGKLVRAHVFKRRFHYILPACRAEFDQLQVNGAAIESIAIESVDPQAVLESRSAIWLEDFENQSYSLALSRILGISPLPHEEEYG
jgi:hypothetical protein